MNKMKSLLIPLFSAVLGGLVVLGFVFLKPNLFSKISSPQPQTEADHFDNIEKDQRKLFQDFDDVFDQNFFSQQDPFEEMRKMRERMEKHFDQQKPGNSVWSSPFDSWFQNRFGGGSVDDIAKREDSDYVYYDVKVRDAEGTSVQTSVQNGYLTITGETKSASPDGAKDESSSKEYFSSTFRRTFPLPPDVDANKMETAHEDDKFIIKFPKNKS